MVSKVAQSLADLKAIKAEMVAQIAKAKAQALAAQAVAKLVKSDHDLFVRAIGAVEPLADHHTRRRALTSDQLVLPEPRQRMRDEASVLVEAISDGFDASTLLETDEHLSFKRKGIGVDVVRKLRRGEWAIQSQLDLHGLRQDEAREALSKYVRDCHRKGLRCVRVVHGKGLGSPGKSPVLKSRVQSWLIQKSQVLAFVQARPIDGGAGALVVLLTPRRAVVIATPLGFVPEKDEPAPRLLPMQRMAQMLQQK